MNQRSPKPSWGRCLQLLSLDLTRRFWEPLGLSEEEGIQAQSWARAILSNLQTDGLGARDEVILVDEVELRGLETDPLSPPLCEKLAELAEVLNSPTERIEMEYRWSTLLYFLLDPETSHRANPGHRMLEGLPRLRQMVRNHFPPDAWQDQTEIDAISKDLSPFDMTSLGLERTLLSSYEASLWAALTLISVRRTFDEIRTLADSRLLDELLDWARRRESGKEPDPLEYPWEVK